VTIACASTDTFAGISSESMPMFIGGQLLGALVAAPFARWSLDRAPN
jgi:hypothetical protein